MIKDDGDQGQGPRTCHTYIRTYEVERWTMRRLIAPSFEKKERDQRSAWNGATASLASMREGTGEGIDSGTRKGKPAV